MIPTSTLIACVTSKVLMTSLPLMRLERIVVSWRSSLPLASPTWLGCLVLWPIGKAVDEPWWRRKWPVGAWN